MTDETKPTEQTKPELPPEMAEQYRARLKTLQDEATRLTQTLQQGPMRLNALAGQIIENKLLLGQPLTPAELQLLSVGK
jgi:hypothetical protein